MKRYLLNVLLSVAILVTVGQAQAQELLTQGQTSTRIDERVARNRAYNQGTTDENGYRDDCSGQASYVAGLPRGLTTSTIPDYCDRIGKDDLRVGDLLNNRTAKTSLRHVVVFLGWANAQRTKYICFEMAGGYTKAKDNGPRIRNVPYPYWPESDPNGYVPMRPRNQVGALMSPESGTVWATFYGKRYAIQSWDCLVDWGFRAEHIQTVPYARLREIAWGGPLPHVVKLANEASVYWVKPEFGPGDSYTMVKRGFTSWENFVGMGFLGSHIRTVSANRLAGYVTGPLIKVVEPRFVAVGGPYFIPDRYWFNRNESFRSGLSFVNLAAAWQSTSLDVRAGVSYWTPDGKPGNFPTTGSINIGPGAGGVHWTGYGSFSRAGRYPMRPAVVVNGRWSSMEIAPDPSMDPSRPLFFDIR